jgi:hypothetical protein
MTLKSTKTPKTISLRRFQEYQIQLSVVSGATNTLTVAPNQLLKSIRGNLIMTDERQVRTIRSPLGDRPVYPQALFNDEDETWEISGLTKREHFAALILAGFCSRSHEKHWTYLSRVEEAISVADLLVSKLAEADRGDA